MKTLLLISVMGLFSFSVFAAESCFNENDGANLPKLAKCIVREGEIHGQCVGRAEKQDMRVNFYIDKRGTAAAHSPIPLIIVQAQTSRADEVLMILSPSNNSSRPNEFGAVDFKNVKTNTLAVVFSGTNREDYSSFEARWVPFRRFKDKRWNLWVDLDCKFQTK